MENKGPFFGWEMQDVFGLSFAIIWDPEQKDFQIAVMVGFLAIAVGYTF